MNKIFISACLLGEMVRYDGKHQKLSHQIIQKWQEEGRLVGGCPECLGGLPVPRAPAEIQPESDKIITTSGEDVTKQFIDGAKYSLAICVREKIKFALLKESSPSCGSNNIYDGNFSNSKISGEGITAKLFREQGIQVFSEHTIEALSHAIGD